MFAKPTGTLSFESTTVPRIRLKGLEARSCGRCEYDRLTQNMARNTSAAVLIESSGILRRLTKKGFLVYGIPA
jgi:hypothetical protein